MSYAIRIRTGLRVRDSLRDRHQDIRTVVGYRLKALETREQVPIPQRIRHSDDFAAERYRLPTGLQLAE